MLEISDLIVDYDPETLRRRDVRRSTVVERLRDNGQHWAARIAGRLPARDDILEREAVDEVLLRAHAEIQRLSEEFSHGVRMQLLLTPIIEALRRRGVDPIRVVDVGCGIGYGIRWLSKHWKLDDVEWIGVDYNEALLAAARGLAAEESLDCEFVVGNAFRLERPAHIYMSTGVVHHFRGDALERFFEQQRREDAYGFLHFDIQPTWLSPVGAFIFHYARFQEPLGQYDGYCSARRAHPGDRLIEASRDRDGDFQVAMFDQHDSLLPVFRVMQALVGLRAELVDDVREALPDGRIGGFS